MRLRVTYIESENGERFAFAFIVEPELEAGITFEYAPSSEVEREELPV